MRRLLFLFVVGLVITLFTSSVSAVECGSIPTNDCEVTVDTTFEPGTYYLPNGVSIGADDVTLDCNTSTLLGSGSGWGIYAQWKHNITISNCKTSNYFAGLELFYTNNSKFFNNEFVRNKYGVIFVLSSFNLFDQNNVSENKLSKGSGFKLTGSYNTFVNNTIMNHNSPGASSEENGIHIQGGDANVIINNYFEGNAMAVKCEPCDEAVIKDNVLVVNPVSLKGSNLTIAYNTMIDQTDNIFWIDNSLIYKNIFNSSIVNILGVNNAIFYNDFYSIGIDYIPNNSYCVDCVGNHYYDNATGPTCTLSCLDNDGDGYISDVDCDDNNVSIHPDAIEVCNGIDDNCNNETDEGFDLENDGIVECFDNCPFAFNPNQDDSEGDNVGDACDKCPDSKSGEEVDQYGCDTFQFCEPFYCGLGCFYADWKNNEEENPNDCTIVIVLREGTYEPKCVPLTCAD